MEREINLEEISDGRRYGLNDMVRAGCGGCEGCSACCHGMGDSIKLDPLDVWRLSDGLGIGVRELLAGWLELKVVDGLILPNIRMREGEDSCPFLSEEGRCTVHSFRPGFCRLFPLGRLYEGRSFTYFLQIHECRRQNRSKVKVSRWIGEENPRAYDAFAADWHYFLKDLEQMMRQRGILGTEASREVCMYVLNEFYVRPYDGEWEFYPQFYERLAKGKERWLCS